MGSAAPTDAEARASLQRIQSADVPDVTDTSYQAQTAALAEHAQSAFNEVLAQYRFMGLLAGIKGPNDTDADVTAAREGIMEALEEFLRAGPLSEQVDSVWGDLRNNRDALQERIYEGFRSGNRDATDGLMEAQSLLDSVVQGHPHNQGEGYLEALANGSYDASYAERVAGLPEEFRADFEALIAQNKQLAGLEDARRAARRQAVRDWFAGVWNGIKDYYNENMELIRNGQWLLATGRIAIDVAIFAAEEVVITAIVGAIVVLTGGLAAGMALALRGAVRMALTMVKQGTRVVRNTRAAWVFRVELNKVIPSQLNSSAMPLAPEASHRIDYDKVIDVEHDLTPDERRAMGEGGQGSTQTDADGTEQGNGGDGQQQSARSDEWEDGSYRREGDPDGVRRTADGEAMIQNKEGTWRPVSQTADPDFPDDSGRRHNPQVGRWGETVADNYAIDELGWERLNGPRTTMNSPFTGPQRIDAIYRDPGPPERFIVSDAKALNAGQGNPGGVRQMSDQWINDRLANSGLTPAQIRAIQADREQVLLRVDRNGNVTEEWLDDAGNPIATPTWREQ